MPKKKFLPILQLGLLSLVAVASERHGRRVIYFWLDQHQEVYFLTAYAKNEKDNLSAAELKEWHQFATEIQKEKNNANKKH